MTAGYSADQIRTAEAPHLAAGEPLMLRAATGLAEQILSLLEERRAVRTPDHAPRVLILVGPGNNGGDALYAGEQLGKAGVEVVIVNTDWKLHDAALNAAIRAGGKVIAVQPLSSVIAVAGASDVVVDGIYGIGSSGRSPELRGTARDVVGALLPVVRSENGPAVVAVDIPSGVGADDGAVPDPTVLPADLTVTFGAMKAGLLLAPAKDFAGQVTVIDVGIAGELAGVEPFVDVD